MSKREDETWSNQKWKPRKQISGAYVSWLRMDLYKILLNLLFFGLLILMFWSGIRLFISHSFFSPLIGSLIVLGELTGFVFLCATIRKNRWRKPSLFLTFLALLIIFVVLSFAGVRPMSDWKNNALSSMKDKSVIADIPEVKQYLVERYLVTCSIYGAKYGMLRTEKEWRGSGDIVLNFDVDEVPAVVNYGFNPTSSISYNMNVDYQLPGSNQNFWITPLRMCDNWYVLESKGETKIRIKSYGCDWWVKIGIE